MNSADHDKAEINSASANDTEEPKPVDHTIIQDATNRFVPGMEVTSESPEMLFGRYRITRSLGQGAMGVVYLAEDSQLRRRVALKFPMISGPGSAKLLDRFYREARSAACLSHRNICTIYDVGEVANTHFIAMAYIEGKTLTDRIQDGAFTSQQVVAELIRKLSQALLEAHQHNVIHRDLKPDNIIVDTHNEPIVMDFGLARQDSTEDARLTASGAIMGTPAYMSPEQTEGVRDSIGPAADIYSLGVIFYELLSGDKPFQGSVASVLVKVLTEEPPPISESRSDVDPQLEAICSQMMAKKVEDRYSSMTDVIEALTHWMQEHAETTATGASGTEANVTQPRSYNVGDTIDGQYQVERRIKGGMSTVYIVKDNVTQKQYALKSLEALEDSSNAANLTGRFEREAAVWVNLDHHDNIVQAHTLLKRGGHPLLLLEYMQGPSLSTVLADYGRLSVQQTVKWARQFCAGMQYVHTKKFPGGQDGTLHRDIKPGNIMFDQFGTLKVTDFGLARISDGRVKSISGEFLGTVAYSNPEQLRDAKHIDRRAEVFSFGIVLFEMLTGTHPFPTSSMAEAIQSIQFRDPDWTLIPEIVRPIVQRCLQKSPELRFESFAELDEMLERVEAKLPSTSSDPICPSCGFIGVTSPFCVVCQTDCSGQYETELVSNPKPNESFMGSTASRYCTCGAELRTGNAFCTQCGRRSADPQKH